MGRNPSVVIPSSSEVSNKTSTDEQKISSTSVTERAPTPIPVHEVNDSDNDNESSNG